MHHLDQQKRSCMCVWDPWKLHVSVYENAQTIISWLLPALKGFYDTHMHPVSVSHRHANRCVRYVYLSKHWLDYFLYTKTVKCMRFLHEDEIFFTSMDPSLNNHSKLKGECADVKSGCGTSVWPIAWTPTVSAKTKFSWHCPFQHACFGLRTWAMYRGMPTKPNLLVWELGVGVYMTQAILIESC